MHQLVGQNVETMPIGVEVQNCNNKMTTYATLNTCDLKDFFLHPCCEMDRKAV
jgi:hypothetical protein